MSESMRQLKAGSLDWQGKEVFDITPVVLGGSPTDPSNKTLLTREEHIKAVVYWNQVVKQLRDNCRNG